MDPGGCLIHVTRSITGRCYLRLSCDQGIQLGDGVDPGSVSRSSLLAGNERRIGSLTAVTGCG
jgi:hypothetical protein